MSDIKTDVQPTAATVLVFSGYKKYAISPLIEHDDVGANGFMLNDDRGVALRIIHGTLENRKSISHTSGDIPIKSVQQAYGGSFWGGNAITFETNTCVSAEEISQIFGPSWVLYDYKAEQFFLNGKDYTMSPSSEVGLVILTADNDN